MVFSKAFQARSFLYAKTQLRAHRRAGKKIKSKKNMEDYQSQSPCRHAKTVLESFFVLCVYRPHDIGIGVASDQIRKSLLCTVSVSSCYRKYYERTNRDIVWDITERCRHRDFNVQHLDHSATFLLAKMPKKEDANKREPKTWKGWNAKWRNDFDFASSLSLRLCVFAFTISRFNFVFQNPKAKSNIL